MQVDRAIDGTLFLLESQIKAAGIGVDKTVEPDLWVLGHAVQLEQVILNLVRNASDAMRDVNDRPRHLLVRLEPEEDGRARRLNGPHQHMVRY